MNKKHLAKITWFSEDEGGRKIIPPEGVRYCPIIGTVQENNIWSIDFICPDFSKTNIIEFSFLSADAPEGLIALNERYCLFEGTKKVAEIYVIA